MNLQSKEVTIYFFTQPEGSRITYFLSTSRRKVLRMISRKENFHFPLSTEFIRIVRTHCYSVSSIFSLRPYHFTYYVLVDILRTRPTTPAPQNLAIAYLQQQGSFVFTFKVLEHLEQMARDEIKRLGGNPKLEQFMELIHCPDFHSPTDSGCSAWPWPYIIFEEFTLPLFYIIRHCAFLLSYYFTLFGLAFSLSAYYI